MPGVELTALTLSLLRDDGALVYVNGFEVARDNLPEGELADTPLASATAGDADASIYLSYALDPAALTAGSNTIAVAVRQAAVTSSDLGFDLEPSASRNAVECPQRRPHGDGRPIRDAMGMPTL